MPGAAPTASPLRGIWLLAPLLALACAERPRDPVQEVRALLDTLVAAAEDGDAQRILAHVAFEFRTEDGLGYADVQSLVLEYLLPGTTVGARLESAEVGRGEDPREIEARLRVRFARGTLLSGRRLPAPPGSPLYAIDLRFRASEGRWVAVWGRYRRVTDAASPSNGGPRTTPGVPST